MAEAEDKTTSSFRVNSESVRPGGKLEVEHNLRGKLCLLEDGTLHVAAAYQADDGVLAYVDLLRRSGMQFRMVPASPSLIEQAYSRVVAMESVRDTSERQKEVIALIKLAVAMGSSDIHFIHGRQKTEVKFRVDGVLLTDRQHRDKMTFMVDHGQLICGTLFQAMCEHSGGDGAGGEYDPNRSQDARMKQQYAELCGIPGARFSSRPKGDGNMVVLRLFYRSEVKGFKAMGFTPEQVDIWHSFVYRRRGVYLISGPTGGGKTTSLYAAANAMLEDAGHGINLMTVEDPVELILPGANQTPLIVDSEGGPDAERKAWRDAIRNCVRMDPDVLMVGEMRDQESAMAGLEFAMTGHGFFGTLHTDAVHQIPDRLRIMGVPLELLVDGSIRGMVNQSLVPLNCVHCRRPYTRFSKLVPPKTRARVERFCPDLSAVYIKGGDRGCPHCNGRGFKGRIVVAEMVEPNDAFFAVYAREGSTKARRYWIENLDGMTKSMRLSQLVAAGMVDPVIGETEVCLLSEDREDVRGGAR